MNFNELNFLQNLKEIEIHKYTKEISKYESIVSATFCENEHFKFYKIFFTNNINLDLKFKAVYLQKFLDILHSLKIPYNILVINNHIFIFPRKHDNLLSTKKFAFFEVLGVYSLDNLEAFNNFTIEDYLRSLNELWYDQESYLLMNEKLEKELKINF
jgi:hypothetical protein